MVELDYNNLFRAVDAFDEPAVAKILETITLEEQKDLDAMLGWLRRFNSHVYKMRQLYKPSNEISDRFEPR